MSSSVATFSVLFTNEKMPVIGCLSNKFMFLLSNVNVTVNNNCIYSDYVSQCWWRTNYAFKTLPCTHLLSWTKVKSKYLKWTCMILGLCLQSTTFMFYNQMVFVTFYFTVPQKMYQQYFSSKREVENVLTVTVKNSLAERRFHGTGRPRKGEVWTEGRY